MLWEPNELVSAAINTAMENRGSSPKVDASALIGMSLRQDIPGGLLSSRARFRFSCQDHFETKVIRSQQNGSEQRGVPHRRVSELDTVHEVNEPPPQGNGNRAGGLPE